MGRNGYQPINCRATGDGLICLEESESKDKPGFRHLYKLSHSSTQPRPSSPSPVGLQLQCAPSWCSQDVVWCSSARLSLHCPIYSLFRIFKYFYNSIILYFWYFLILSFLSAAGGPGPLAGPLRPGTSRPAPVRLHQSRSWGRFRRPCEIKCIFDCHSVNNKREQSSR